MRGNFANFRDLVQHAVRAHDERKTGGGIRDGQEQTRRNPKMVKILAAQLDKAGRKQTAQIMRDILDYHASPAQAADSAKVAGVKMLVLSHVVPSMPSPYLDAAFLDGVASHFNGPIVVGEDGQYLSLSANSKAIERGSWF